MNHLVSSLLHLGGALAALFAAPSLLRRLGGGWEVRLAWLCYVASVTTLLLASASYHAARQALGAGAPTTEVLVRLDHSAVWLILAGFFVLPHLIVLRGAWRWVPLGLVWAAAAMGVASKLLWFSHESAARIVVPYALASLVGIASTVKFVLLRGLRHAAWLLGFWAAFVLAACCFVFKVPNLIDGWVGFHEVWHVGILIGIYGHWRFVLQIAPEAAAAFPPAGAEAPHVALES